MEYSIGDKVNIIYTGAEYTAGISIETLEKIARKNPHTISDIPHWSQDPFLTRYYLEEGENFYWPSVLLRPVEIEIKWEV